MHLLKVQSFVPDVVVIICSPKQIMLLTQAALYKEGGRIETEFAGKQSLCSDAVAEPYLTGKMGITVGCTGSRTYTGIQESELTVGIPAKMLTGSGRRAKGDCRKSSCALINRGRRADFKRSTFKKRFLKSLSPSSKWCFS